MTTQWFSVPAPPPRGPNRVPARPGRRESENRGAAARGRRKLRRGGATPGTDSPSRCGRCRGTGGSSPPAPAGSHAKGHRTTSERSASGGMRKRRGGRPSCCGERVGRRAGCRGVSISPPPARFCSTRVLHRRVESGAWNVCLPGDAIVGRPEGAVRSRRGRRSAKEENVRGMGRRAPRTSDGAALGTGRSGSRRRGARSRTVCARGLRGMAGGSRNGRARGGAPRPPGWCPRVSNGRRRRAAPWGGAFRSSTRRLRHGDHARARSGTKQYVNARGAARIVGRGAEREHTLAEAKPPVHARPSAPAGRRPSFAPFPWTTRIQRRPRRRAPPDEVQHRLLRLGREQSCRSS